MDRRKKHSALFTYIEQHQGNRLWGHFLDAGTGAKSLAWVGDLATTQWTAVDDFAPYWQESVMARF